MNPTFTRALDRIPPQLRERPGARFTVILSGQKRPEGKDWSGPNGANYAINDPPLAGYLKEGHSYGVLCGHAGLAVVDLDDLPALEELGVLQKIPETFQVRTGRDGRHNYFDCPELDRQIGLYHPTLKDEDGEPLHLGEIQSKGQQVVGPGSIHANNNRYEVVKNAPILTISRADLLNIFNGLILTGIDDPAEEPRRAEARRRSSGGHGLGDHIPIDSVAWPKEVKEKHGSEVIGTHPVHSSKGGKNFAVNTAKNSWHCFRHGTGGGPLEWLAVEAGLILCQDAKPGCLNDKELFKKVLQIARDKGFYIPPPEKPKAEPTDKALLESLLEKIKEDPGIIYEPEYFGMLKRAYRSDPRQWERAKKIFRDYRISVRDFVKAIKEDEDDVPVVETPILILNDGRIAEMVARNGNAKYAVYDPATKVIEYVPEIMQDETRYIPPTEDEIFKKGYVTLPSEAEEYSTELSLYQEIKAFAHTYLEVSPDYESIASFYPMLTWVNDVVAVIAYLRAKGDWGVGKSRFLDVFRALCYRSISTTGAMSEAPIFRIMDKWKGTLIIDEGDFGKSRDSTAAMEKILVCGYERGKPIIRCNPNDPAEVNVFDPFGPKIIATRYAFRDKALESRCFTEVLRESIRTDIPVQLPPKFEEDALHLRNKLLMYRFRNRELVKNTSEAGIIDIDLSELPKRIQQAARPLSVILANYPELLVTLKEFLEAKSKTLVLEASETTEGHLVRTIEGIEPISNDGKKITWDTGYRELTELIKTSSGNFKIGMQQIISKANSLGFKTEKGMIDGDQKRRITCDVPLFERLKNRYIPEVETATGGNPLDEVDKLDSEVGLVHEKCANSTPNPSNPILTSGGGIACPACPPCPSGGHPIAISNSTDFASIAEIEPEFRKFKAGMAKRNCCLCGRSFPYDLTPYFNNGQSGYICSRCHMEGPPKPPQPADTQTRLN